MKKTMKHWFFMCLAWLLLQPGFAQTTPAHLEHAQRLQTGGQYLAAFELYNQLADTSASSEVFAQRARFLYVVKQLKDSHSASEGSSQTPRIAQLDSILDKAGSDEKLLNQMLEKDLNRAIELDSMNARAYLLRGVIKFKTDRKKAAIKDLDRVIALDPSLKDAYALREKAMEEMSRTEIDSVAAPPCSAYYEGKFKVMDDSLTVVYATFSSSSIHEYFPDTKITTKKSIKRVDDCSFEATYIDVSASNLNSWMKGSKESVVITPVDNNRFRTQTTYRGTTKWTEYIRVE